MHKELQNSIKIHVDQAVLELLIKTIFWLKSIHKEDQKGNLDTQKGEQAKPWIVTLVVSL